MQGERSAQASALMARAISFNHADYTACVLFSHMQGERSVRALALTARVISFNHADYTAWEWRWQCLLALGSNLTQEYEFTDSILSVGLFFLFFVQCQQCLLPLGTSTLGSCPGP